MQLKRLPSPQIRSLVVVANKYEICGILLLEKLHFQNFFNHHHNTRSQSVCVHSDGSIMPLGLLPYKSISKFTFKDICIYAASQTFFVHSKIKAENAHTNAQPSLIQFKSRAVGIAFGASFLYMLSACYLFT